MSQLYRNTALSEPIGDAVTALAAGAVRQFLNIEPGVLVWWCFTAVVAASNARTFFGELSGAPYYFLAIAGSAGCGWAWLLSRTLFRPAAKALEPWTLMVVGAIVVVESYWHLTSGFSGGGLSGELRRIGENAASLICFFAIALVAVEAWSGYGDALPHAERRFRRRFLFVYGAIIAISMVWAVNADAMTFAAKWSDATLAGCSLAAVMLSRLALNYRRRHPLLEIDPQSRSRKKRARAAAGDDAADPALARRILEMVEDEDIFTMPNLKVAAFSEMLGEQDYKVTQCITGPLQYRNFNHFINSYRIAHAKRALSDPRNINRPILSIAFDCGFGSIGPFNRAFKQEVGMTPREFRETHCKELQ